MLRGGGQEEGRRGGARERRRVVLGDVIAVETGFVGRLQQQHPLFVGLRQRLVAAVEVIEDAELHEALAALPPGFGAAGEFCQT
jgi:hypothetical protein